MATVGMRIYTPTGKREDKRGHYEGWGERFDEKIPLFSPRIAKFLTMSQKCGNEPDEIDESLDDVVQIEPGFSRVWAVPRPRKCASKEYLRHVSVFCSAGALDLFLEVFEKQEASDEPEGFNLCALAILMWMISLPSSIYHRDVAAEYAPKIIEAGT